jgi:hypothetical protein
MDGFAHEAYRQLARETRKTLSPNTDNRLRAGNYRQ